jgi:hypothetical protein
VKKYVLYNKLTDPDPTALDRIRKELHSELLEDYGHSLVVELSLGQARDLSKRYSIIILPQTTSRCCS